MSPRARVRQILLGMLAAAFAAALTGMLYQITLVRRDQRQHPMPGILVDVLVDTACISTASVRVHRPSFSMLDSVTAFIHGAKCNPRLPHSPKCAPMTVPVSVIAKRVHSRAQAVFLLKNFEDCSSMLDCLLLMYWSATPLED